MNDTTMFDDVARRLACDGDRAERVVMAVLQELRDRLPEQEAADLEAQLPTSFRRLWFQPGRTGKPVERTHRADLVARVRARVPLRDDAEAERAVLAVFGAIQRNLRSARGIDGEAWDVFSVLPKDLKPMWLDARASS